MRWRSGNKSLVPRYGLVLSALMNLESLGLLMGALNDRHVERIVHDPWNPVNIYSVAVEWARFLAQYINIIRFYFCAMGAF